MDLRFWLERWNKGEIGFHQREINPYIQRFWNQLVLAPTARILVPLCGKSHDMAWLARQGHKVLGVEISEEAIKAFFSGQQLTAALSQQGPFVLYRAANIEILCGDFFSLDQNMAGSIGGVYDRASLVAFPPDMRLTYVRHLTSLLSPGTTMLLVSVEYPAGEMDGPPFPVFAEEVISLYGTDFDIRFLHRQDALDNNPRFKERGLSAFVESVYVLTRK